MNILPSFSFIYNNIPSDLYLAGLSKKTETKTLDSNRTEITDIWEDTRAGLQVKCTSVRYSDFPVVEWTTYFKNNGTVNTSILKDIKGLDTVFLRGNGSEYVLHGNKGEYCVAESYEPYKLTLDPGCIRNGAPQMGKATGGPDGWPYYNLQMNDGGVIIALGWPGQWSSSFVRDNDNGLRVTAGQELTNLYLKPGEEIRTPLVVLLFWEGDDVVASQNLWRKWFWKHNTPKVNGKLPAPFTHVQLCGSFGDGENVMWENVNRYINVGIKPDVCWRDAGWYPHFDGPEQGDLIWTNTGTWDPDPVRFPNGFRKFSDWVHDNGMKFLLWFEPERVGDPESFLGKEHPEWLLETTDTEEFGKTYGKILDEGNEEALSWLIAHVDGMIKSQRIDWYREDMNGPGPLRAWRNNDAEDRQGITENFYVQGHLKFWDEIVRRNPGLYIDTCASGGRRNDLETMRRAVPLLRSDYQFPQEDFSWSNQSMVFEANQCHTWALSSWFPYYGSGVNAISSYEVRSFLMPVLGISGPAGWEKDDKSVAQIKKDYDEFWKVAPLMLCDYYPLTSYSLDLDQWIAWQFNRPEEGDGVIQAFRRKNNTQVSRILWPKGIDAAVIYEVYDMDTGTSVNVSGKSILEDGLTVRIDNKPGSALLIYKIVKK